jgi:hypothetical protein
VGADSSIRVGEVLKRITEVREFAEVVVSVACITLETVFAEAIFITLTWENIYVIVDLL